MQEAILTVTDMHCESCEQRLTRAVGGLSGVVSVDADHRNARVRAVFDPDRTSKAEICEVISRAGYSVAE